jgi:beta-glucosidase
VSYTSIPDGLILGTSTSAYQIEGAWQADGKGPSIWDRFTHQRGTISDGTTGDQACDHYNRMEEDVELIRRLGVDSYRFSVSWPRVLPEGTGRVNAAGLDFYDRLVDRLCAHGISPLVTLYHWDLPAALYDKGGWTNRSIAGWFADYAAVMAERLGDRVDHWITLNEPLSVTAGGHVAGIHAPGDRSLIKAATAIHFLLLAHGLATDAIRAVDEGAAIGIANAFSPIYAARRQDERIARRIGSVINEIFMDPLYFGHYPRSFAPLLHLLNRSIRSSDWDVIARPPDFLGVNHYSRYIAQRTIIPFLGFRFLRPVSEKVVFTDIDWEVYPPGFRRILGWIRERYGNPPVLVTENGASFDEPMQERRIYDHRRMDYLNRYMQEMLHAIADGSDIQGYYVWSLMDNFEWAHGYTQRFGLVHINYETLERLPKESFSFYQKVCRTRRLPDPGSYFRDESPVIASQPSDS